MPGWPAPNRRCERATRRSGRRSSCSSGATGPSFRERAEEIRARPLGSPVAGAGERYIAATEARRAGTGLAGADADAALGDLLTELGHALEVHSGVSGDLERQLREVARAERHPLHRGYWAALGLAGGRDGMHAPTQDPIVRLWRAAVASLTGRSSPASPEELVRLWLRCPQILRPTRNER